MDAVSNAVTPIKPKLRGWLHLCAAPLALAGGIVLIALADNGRARIASSVFAFSAVMLFGTSALYHRRTWGPRGEAILRRLDHANIFLIIAGTYTPFTVLLLHGSAERALLYTVWIGALAGIAFRVFWLGAPRWIYTPCYVALGWAAVFFMPQFLHSGGTAIVVMMIVGGVLYSLRRTGLRHEAPGPLAAVVRVPRGVPHADHRGLLAALHRGVDGRHVGGAGVRRVLM